MSSQIFGIHDFPLFLASGLLLNLTPGPDTAYILGRSIAQGRAAGLASAFGITIGSIFHIRRGAWTFRYSRYLCRGVWCN
jgi:threonine/homoserine/homoserine lactone efflux protein